MAVLKGLNPHMVASKGIRIAQKATAHKALKAQFLHIYFFFALKAI